MFIATAIIAVLLASAFLGAGVSKLSAVQAIRESATHLGLSIGAYRVIGAVEIGGAAGVLIGLRLPGLGVAAAIGFALLMAGALGFHLRARDGLAKWAPTPFLALLAVAYIIARLASA